MTRKTKASDSKPFLTALRHIVNLEAGFTGPTPEREALVARTFIGRLCRNSCKHKDSPLQIQARFANPIFRWK